MSDRRPRISLHPDQDYISIGFEGTNDTLLKMPSRPEGWGDHAVAVEWVAAINVALDLAGAREIDCPDCGSPYDENCADCDVPAGWISLAARLAEVEAERDRLDVERNEHLDRAAAHRKVIALQGIERDEVEAERDRLAQELEDKSHESAQYFASYEDAADRMFRFKAERDEAITLLRGLLRGIEVEIEEPVTSPLLSAALDTDEFLARFPVEDGEA